MSESRGKYTIINYHYIENPNSDFMGIYPCTIGDFEKQIKYLASNFKIVSVPELYESALNGGKEKLCAVTFDDGLKDQYRNAVPILKKYAAPAVFFPITSTWEGYMPSAHKIHVLLSQFSAEDLVKIFNSFLLEQHPEAVARYEISSVRRLIKTRRLHEDISTANLKETLIFLEKGLRKDFLDFSFRKLDLDEKKMIPHLFMSEKEIKSLADSGFGVGGHSHRHDSLITLSKDDLVKDIRFCADNLLRVTGQKPKIFSYPYGHYNETVVEVVKKVGFEYGLTIKTGAVRSGDSVWSLPRCDSKDIKAMTEKGYGEDYFLNMKKL